MTEIRKLKATEIKDTKLRILKSQFWCCAICGLNMLSDTGNACLDHSHTTGHIRGVLCRNCNRGEGKVKTQATTCKRGGDSINWLINLVAYLLKHQTPQSHLVHPTHKTEEDKRIRRNKLAKVRRENGRISKKR